MAQSGIQGRATGRQFMFIAGKTKAKDAVAYIIAQCIGAIIGAGILLIVARGLPTYSTAENGLGQNGYGLQSPSASAGVEGYSMLACFVAEVVLTALFLFVIFGSTSKNAPQGFAGISIGLTLVLIHIVGIPITGTSVNPARSLGPAVFMRGEALTQLWLFWAAPIIGAIVAALAWKYLFEQK